jgi:hypothetical protein
VIDPCDPEAESFAARDTLPSGAPLFEPPFIPARYFTPGRAEALDFITIHTTQNPCAAGVARNVALGFTQERAPGHEASAHYVVGPELAVQCVLEEDTAYGAGKPANARGLHFEHTARAEFTEADWTTPEARALLSRSAVLVAGACRRHGIPVVRLDAAALQRGERGITGHVDVSRAWHGSDHWDPGGAFPWSAYLDAVRAALEAL